MKILNIAEELRNNSYPGRGIVLGRSADDKQGGHRLLYHGSQRQQPQPRLLRRLRTASAPRRLTRPRWTDPSLIIYHPVRVFGGETIVTNGDQTDTICEALAAGQDPLSQALRTRHL